MEALTLYLFEFFFRRFSGHSLKGPIHDSDLQSQPRFPTATSTKFPVYGLRQPQPPPWLADRCCGCCWSEFSDIWWAELKVAVEVAVVYGQKRPDLVSCASKTMLYSPGHQSRGPTLLRTAIQLRKIEQIGRCVCG